jgi:hypothetical protein
MCFISLLSAIVFASLTMINSGKPNNNSSDGLTANIFHVELLLSREI